MRLYSILELLLMSDLSRVLMVTLMERLRRLEK